MKKIFLISISIFISLVSSPVFAQETLTGPGEEIDSAVVAPIDDYVWVLALVGLLFVFLKFRDVYKRGADLQE